MLLENNSDKDKVYLMLGDAYKRKCNYKISIIKNYGEKEKG